MDIKNINLEVETTGLAEAIRLLALDINGKRDIDYNDKVFMFGILVNFYNELDKDANK